MKLTKRAVDALAVATRATGERYYDTETRGFGISAFPSGQKVFFIEYGPERRRRRMRLGPFGTLTVEQAREEARQKLADVVKGHDPLEEKEKHRAMPLFKKWVEDYLVDLPLRKKRFDQDVYYLQGTKPGRKRSGKGAKGNLEDKRRKPRQSEAMERWGSRPLDSITRGEVEGLLAHVAETRGTTTANRCYASLRACFEAAVRVGVLSSNPAVYVRKYRESEPRARVLSDDELKKVREAVDALPDASVRMAFYLLIDTGARKSEVLRAR
jgi:integrase